MSDLLQRFEVEAVGNTYLLRGKRFSVLGGMET